jgi:predicted transcriptional regulator of viral defense system
MVTKLEKAAPKIFEALAARPIRTHSDLQILFRENNEAWELPVTLSLNKFIQFAIEHGKLQKHRLEFPHRPATRYSWGDVKLENVIQSIHPKGYFSHYTAMQHHDLTEQIPKTIYFNIEQRLKGGGTEPTQTAMDRAFKGKCRVSQNSVNVGERTIRILNGRNTGEMGVITIANDNSLEKRVTNIERTLIDITVRPVYSGGVFQVAEAFAAAASEVSIERLVTYLRCLNFTYPYHQSIGYYMNRSGKFSNSQLETIRELGLKYDFYLDYGMKKTNYIKEWRLHVPQGF